MVDSQRYLKKPPVSEHSCHGNEQAFSARLHTLECDNVERLVAADQSPKTVLRIVDQARALAETVSGNNQGPGTQRVACHKGCSWCCHQTVLVNAPEALRIAEYINTLEDASLRQAFLDQLHQLDRQTRGLSPMARSSVHSPCAFLVDGACGIYPVRPLACAEFTSFNVMDCVHAFLFGFQDNSVTCDKSRKLIFHSVRTGMAQGLREGLPGSDSVNLELTAAVLDALNTPDAAAQWLAGEPVFASAHLVEDDPALAIA